MKTDMLYWPHHVKKILLAYRNKVGFDLIMAQSSSLVLIYHNEQIPLTAYIDTGFSQVTYS